MDLTKFWEAQRKPSATRSEALIFHRSPPLLEAIGARLDDDLTIITRYPPAEADDFRSFHGMRVISGSFEKPGPKVVWESLEKKLAVDYVFLQIPAKPGILITQPTSGNLVCERATRVLPDYTQDDGSRAMMTLFVTRAPVLAELRIVDPVTVRTESGKTLSLHQFSELILSFALESENG